MEIAKEAQLERQLSATEKKVWWGGRNLLRCDAAPLPGRSPSAHLPAIAYPTSCIISSFIRQTSSIVISNPRNNSCFHLTLFNRNRLSFTASSAAGDCQNLTMSERIIPDGISDAHPISGLEEFQTHLAELENDPAVPFNLKLLDDIELQLTGNHPFIHHYTSPRKKDC